MAVEYSCCGTNFFLHILIIVFLVVFAGLMSGLTLGLMSMSLVDLEVLAKSGTPKDRKHAGTFFFFFFCNSVEFYVMVCAF
jgi:metal transporter CNNM